MKLRKNEKLLYDSCDIYAEYYIKYPRLTSFFISCGGDENILELCNRCPLYKPDEFESQ